MFTFFRKKNKKTMISFVYIFSSTSNPRTTNDGENDWSANTGKFSQFTQFIKTNIVKLILHNSSNEVYYYTKTI